MFGLFNKQNNEESKPDWYTELVETQERFFAFIT